MQLRGCLLAIINFYKLTGDPLEDYISFESTTVTISAGTAAGQTIRVAPVTVHDDNSFERTEFLMFFINPNPAERLSTKEDGSTAVVYIIDNDGELALISYIHLQLWCRLL